LNHNYPNPFNAQTQIDFALPHNANITLKVFNFMGQEIAVLAEGEYEAGRHTVIFNAQDLSSGIYFVRLQAEGIALSQKMILLK
jgi:hypothetical protein